MAQKPKSKMPISERAKQFMPFAAVKGLDDAIFRVEQQLIPMPHASYEDQQKINDALNMIKIGEIVTITYLNEKSCASVTGKIADIDYALKTLYIDNVKILFENIIQINL